MFFPLSFSKKCKKLWVEFWKFWKTKKFFLRCKFLVFFQSEDERNFIVFIFSAIYYTCDSLTYFTAFMQFQSEVQWKTSGEVGSQIRLPARITGNWIWVNQTCLFIESLLLYIYMQARRKRWNGTGPPAHPPYPGGIFFLVKLENIKYLHVNNMWDFIYWTRHKWQKVDSLFWIWWFSSKWSYHSYQ